MLLFPHGSSLSRLKRGTLWPTLLIFLEVVLFPQCGLGFDDTEDVTETTSSLAQKTEVSRRTIARDMDVLKEKGFVIRIATSHPGPVRG